MYSFNGRKREMTMKHENITLGTNELLKSTDVQTNCMNEQIAAAMLLMSSLNAELTRLNRIQDQALAESDEAKSSALQDQYDKEFEQFNVTVSFKNHTVEIVLGNMYMYDAFLNFLLDYANNADIYR